MGHARCQQPYGGHFRGVVITFLKGFFSGHIPHEDNKSEDFSMGVCHGGHRYFKLPFFILDHIDPGLAADLAVFERLGHRAIRARCGSVCKHFKAGFSFGPVTVENFREKPVYRNDGKI